MTEPLPEIEANGERVRVSIPSGVWEGSPAEAERLLSGLHYTLARARPGTNVGSMFVNGRLWGAKFVEDDPAEAIREMRHLVGLMREKLDSLEAEQRQVAR